MSFNKPKMMADMYKRVVLKAACWCNSQMQWTLYETLIKLLLFLVRKV